MDDNADFESRNHHVCAVTSWKTGTLDYVQSLKLLITTAINGNDDYNDTLLDPVFPNAKTREEMFSKDYTDEQLKFGIIVVDRCFDDIKASGGILTLDLNKDLFHVLKYKCTWTYIEDRGYELFYDYQKKVYLYFKVIPNDIPETTPKIVIIKLHDPLCIIGDSDNKIELSQETHIKRAGRALCCQNFWLGYQDKQFCFGNMEGCILFSHHLFVILN